MNQSFLERNAAQSARPASASNVRHVTVATNDSAEKQGTGLSSGSTRGCPPPTFAIASPGQGEGEAMAKAGGGKKEV